MLGLFATCLAEITNASRLLFAYNCMASALRASQCGFLHEILKWKFFAQSHFQLYQFDNNN